MKVPEQSIAYRKAERREAYRDVMKLTLVCSVTVDGNATLYCLVVHHLTLYKCTEPIVAPSGIQN